MERILHEEGVILRHTLVERFEHWVLALSGFILVFSGFGELPMYKTDINLTTLLLSPFSFTKAFYFPSSTNPSTVHWKSNKP